MLFSLTTTGKVLLLLVGGAFIAFALVTALVIPKRSPGFPGRHLGSYITVTVLFFLAQLTTVWYVTSKQEVHEERAAETAPGDTTHGETTPEETTPEETTPAETTPEETTPAETTPPETGPAEGGEGSTAVGKEIFAANCVSCHTLADAGATGTVGPNLDESRPASGLIVDRVMNGKGVMPSFADKLDEQQIAEVAAYVSSVAGG